MTDEKKEALQKAAIAICHLRNVYADQPKLYKKINRLQNVIGELREQLCN
jgi:hypothetical protein